MTASAQDVRLDLVASWVREDLGTDRFTLAPASAEASFRRYFRIRPETPWRAALVADRDGRAAADGGLPALRAVAELLAEAGVHAPEVLSADLERGFLLLTDLGTHVSRRARRLFGAGALRRCDRLAAALARRDARGHVAKLRRSAPRARARAFSDWYVGKHLGRALSTAQARTLADAFRSIVATISPSRACTSIAITIRAT
jgi:aminoglycoside/choline kinase family phosphotransferase